MAVSSSSVFFITHFIVGTRSKTALLRSTSLKPFKILLDVHNKINTCSFITKSNVVFSIKTIPLQTTRHFNQWICFLEHSGHYFNVQTFTYKYILLIVQAILWIPRNKRSLCAIIRLKTFFWGFPIYVPMRTLIVFVKQKQILYNLSTLFLPKPRRAQNTWLQPSMCLYWPPRSQPNPWAVTAALWSLLGLPRAKCKIPPCGPVGKCPPSEKRRG